MEEIIKKKMKVSDAEGWYIAEPVRIMIEESIVDETTGELSEIKQLNIRRLFIDGMNVLKYDKKGDLLVK